MIELLAVIIVSAFFVSMRYQSGGKKRSPVNQIMRFRGNEAHTEQWRSAYDRLPIEMQIGEMK